MSLPEHERIAFAVAFGELDGGKFNFDRMEWEKQE